MRKTLLGLVILCLAMTIPVVAQSAVNIVVHPNRQKVTLKVTGGVVRHVVMNAGENLPLATEVASVISVSERLGWGDATVAKGIFDPASGIAKIKNTCNSDRALWAVKLVDGRIRYLNVEKIVLRYHADLGTPPPPVKLANGSIKYGAFKKEAVEFNATTSRLNVRFNNNRITKVVIWGEPVFDLNPLDVSHAIWMSDKCGWYDDSEKIAPLQNNMNGNLIAKITGMPDFDSGLIGLKVISGPHAGRWAWLNINDWIISGGTVDPITRNINYDYGR